LACYGDELYVMTDAGSYRLWPSSVLQESLHMTGQNRLPQQKHTIFDGRTAGGSDYKNLRRHYYYGMMKHLRTTECPTSESPDIRLLVSIPARA
jgi:hypothetical protein